MTRVIDAGIPVAPTSRTVRLNGEPIGPQTAPPVQTQHDVQRRGITMEQALAEQETIAKRAAENEDPDYRAAADWLRGKSSQRILIELVCRIMKLEELNNGK
jgi:hypothetical protein